MIAKDSYYHAYKLAATQTVARTRQIVLLYDGAIRYMQQAREAIEQNDIPQRYNLLVKAGEIVLALQNSLDFESGGTVAQILHDFYARVDMEIISIHSSNSLPMCDHVIRQLKQMRDAWNQIDQQQSAEGKEAQEKSEAAAAASSLPLEMLANIALSA